MAVLTSGLAAAACVEGVQGLGAASSADGGAARTDGDLVAVDGGAPDGGLPAARSVFDPEATLLEPRIVTAFAPSDAPRPVMQGGAFRLVWTGETYLLFWVENRYSDPAEGSNLRAMVRRVGPELGPMRTLRPDPVDPDREHMLGAPLAVVEPDRGRVALAWTTSRWQRPRPPAGTVQMAWTDFEGRLVEGPVDVRVFDQHGPFNVSMHADPAGAGYLLFDVDYPNAGLRVSRIDPSGRTLDRFPAAGIFGETFGPGSVRMGAVQRAPNGWHVTYSDRRAGQSDVVYWVRLDEAFRVIERRRALEEEDLAAGPVWPAAAPAFMAAAVYPDRLRLFALAGTGEREIEGRFWSRFVVEPTGRRIGALALTGESSSGLAAGMAYRAYDADRDVVSPAHMIQNEDGRCVESADAVSSGEPLGHRMGVAWVMACGAGGTDRTLHFTELRGR